MSELRRLCVYCGSSAGNRPGFADAADAVGRLLAESGIGVVYGGASVGLMGRVADAALRAGGEVIGVLPGKLFEREVAHAGLTELRVVSSMHERKALMSELSDGFIALPGGYGTIEEVVEAVTWNQLGIHAKPVGLLDVDGYFDLLLAFLDRGVADGLLAPTSRALLHHDTDPTALLGQLRVAAGLPHAPEADAPAP
jgi:uncharacterized protein (TIGR00730 family)